MSTEGHSATGVIMVIGHMCQSTVNGAGVDEGAEKIYIL